ncbi:MAG TPA: glycoside-pentoside-hexuronide (GPH):cation symporter [Verrucomicrobiae bacterium]|nr:glycoside-pentoside-hexuronide (GPH):cation symporter [Verrucomicrobiae bacterium]
MSAPTLTLGRKIAIGAGDFGFNLYWQFASLYLLYFYTDGLGLNPAIAGAIYMGALIWDAALDPLIGLVADKTRTRFGRYRPYLIFGAVPLGFIFVLNLMRPFQAHEAAILFTALTHVAFRTVYAIVSIPYAALFARITRDSAQRGDLAGFRMVFATLAAVSVAALSLPFANALGTLEDPLRGWTLIGAAYAVVAALTMWLTAWAAHGLDRVDDEPSVRHRPADVARSLFSNHALLVLLGAVVVGSFCSTLFGKNLLYYFKYVVGEEALGATALTVGALTTALFVPVWSVLLRFIGKRNIWICGAVPGLTGLVLWHLLDGQDPWLLIGCVALQAVGAASYAVGLWSMLPDTVEYGEWKSGVRTESLVFGLTVLGQKAALGLGAGVLGFALTQIGYVPNAVQTPETLADLKALMFWIPLTGGLISLGFICLYPINRANHGRMVEDIAARKLAAAE